MIVSFQPAELDFQKTGGLLPVIIQDAGTDKVLMLGYMNLDALEKTLSEGTVTFFSRSKNRLWTKGETSGHFFHLVDAKVDCDQDTILMKVNPKGPACHTGADTCFNEDNKSLNFLQNLENIIQQRRDQPSESSYTSKLFQRGINKVAQKVGEEAVELVIEAKDNNTELFLDEAADLLYHYLILLAAKGHELGEVVAVLEKRNK
jgi:phosphoribosyl-ATP pyrophosphohydrolase/phosphoribosyl-AMP cyclohydrolase